MASRTSPSRIPVAVRSPPQPVKTSRIPVRSPQIHVRKPPPPPSNGQVAKKQVTEPLAKKQTESNLQPCHENGLIIDTSPKCESPQRQKGKGFETFLMTGDMIIRTTPPHQKSPRTDSSKSPSLKNDTEDLFAGNYGNTCQHNASPSKIHSSKSHPAPMPPVSKNSTEIVKAPVATMEDLSDMSQSESSTCSDALVASMNEKFVETPAVESSSPRKEPKCVSKPQTDTSKVDEVDGVVLTVNGECNRVVQDQPNSVDSGVQQDSQSSDSDGDATKYSSLPEVTNSEDASQSVMTSSQSEEKITGTPKQNQSVVRTSKSHENYLESESGLSLVNIDIDDNISYSLDTLACSANSPAASAEQVSEPTSHSYHSSPDRREEKSNERVFMPGFISLDEPKALRDTNKNHNNQTSVNSDSEDQSDQSDSLPQCDNISGDDTDKNSDGNESPDQLSLSDLDMSDIGSLYHQPTKSVDRPSAARLAKRLFHMDGFKKGDISRHLSKKNDFSTLVAEEYFKYFEIKGDTLDVALRRFLKQCNLSGETQERERVLAHFSRFYMQCNPNTFNSEDACHTLTCAIMLLNTDLHGQFVGRKMTCAEFVENLADLNDGENFPKDVIKAIYHAIKAEPLEWATDDEPHEKESSSDLPGPAIATVPQPFIGSNPFLDLPDPSKTTEYKKGYVMRKCCLDADGRKTPLGRRGWKMFCAVLRDMILYLYKDEHQLKKGTFVENVNNAVRIHHSLATKATDYTKKQHVFRLQTADYAEFLFQTSDSKELQEWIDTINMVAATFSAPVLAGAVGSKVKKFQRPLFPASYTQLNMKDQLRSHEERVAAVEVELQQHRSSAPEKGAKSRIISEYLEKEAFLEYEIRRFKTYVYLLQGKMMAYPDLEPSLVETTIGEDEEVMTATPSTTLTAGYSPWKPVQRSLSDRPIHSDTEDECDVHVNKQTFDTYL